MFSIETFESLQNAANAKMGLPPFCCFNDAAVKMFCQNTESISDNAPESQNTIRSASVSDQTLRQIHDRFAKERIKEQHPQWSLPWSETSAGKRWWEGVDDAAQETIAKYLMKGDAVSADLSPELMARLALAQKEFTNLPAPQEEDDDAFFKPEYRYDNDYKYMNKFDL